MLIKNVDGKLSVDHQSRFFDYLLSFNARKMVYLSCRPRIENMTAHYFIASIIGIRTVEQAKTVPYVWRSYRFTHFSYLPLIEFLL